MYSDLKKTICHLCSILNYLTSLFQIVNGKNGSIGIHFDDDIDKAYLGIGFNKENGLPYIDVLNSIQFE